MEQFSKWIPTHEKNLNVQHFIFSYEKPQSAQLEILVPQFNPTLDSLNRNISFHTDCLSAMNFNLTWRPPHLHCASDSPTTVAPQQWDIKMQGDVDNPCIDDCVTHDSTRSKASNWQQGAKKGTENKQRWFLLYIYNKP